MLNKIVAKNFQSWKSLEFNVTSGVTLIDGWNEDDQTSEGSGKSSILNAISWCLFGKVPKEVNIDEVIKYDEKSASVGLFFDDGTQIVRIRGPNDLFMIRNAKTIKGRDSRETQQLIQDYIGLSFESFCQSSYFPQNYSKKFLLSNQEEKGKILSDIQDISIFDKAKKEVQELAKLESNKLSGLVGQIQIETSNLSGSRTQKKLIEDFIQQKVKQYELHANDLKSKREALINSIGQNSAKLHQVLAIVEGINVYTLSQGIEQLNTYKADLAVRLAEVTFNRNNISSVAKQVKAKEQEGQRYSDRYKLLDSKVQKLQSFMENPVKQCPTCGSISENQDTSHAKQEMESIQAEMAQIWETLTSISGFLDSTVVQSDSDLMLESHQLEKSIKESQVQISEFERKIRDKQMYADNATFIQNQITESQNLLASYDKSIESLMYPDLSQEQEKLQAIRQIEETVGEKIKELQNLESQTRIYLERLETLKEGFKEIKSYVFNSALNELSFRANEFLTTLFQVPAAIMFKNEDLKIETQILLNGKTPSVGLLSGGQFRRFSLAVDLALSDMTSSRKSSKLNLLVLDEYFKDVSESTMEKCLDLLKLRKSPVLLIEHNTIFKNIVDNVFFVRHVKGTSYESR